MVLPSVIYWHCIGFNESQHSSRGRFMPLMLALDTVRRILQDFRVSSSKKFWFLELLPGPLFLYCHFEACFSCFYKCFVNTYYHYCGTCKMTSPGSNDDSVVDDELRVQVSIYDTSKCYVSSYLLSDRVAKVFV